MGWKVHFWLLPWRSRAQKKDVQMALGRHKVGQMSPICVNIEISWKYSPKYKHVNSEQKFPLLLLCWRSKEPVSCQITVSETAEKKRPWIWGNKAYTDIHTQMHGHTHTDTHMQTETHADAHSDTYRYTQRHTQTHTQTHIMKLANAKVNQNKSTVARDRKWIPWIYIIWIEARI